MATRSNKNHPVPGQSNKKPKSKVGGEINKISSKLLNDFGKRTKKPFGGNTTIYSEHPSTFSTNIGGDSEDLQEHGNGGQQNSQNSESRIETLTKFGAVKSRVMGVGAKAKRFFSRKGRETLNQPENSDTSRIQVDHEDVNIAPNRNANPNGTPNYKNDTNDAVPEKQQGLLGFLQQSTSAKVTQLNETRKAQQEDIKNRRSNEIFFNAKKAQEIYQKHAQKNGMTNQLSCESNHDDDIVKKYCSAQSYMTAHPVAEVAAQASFGSIHLFHMRIFLLTFIVIHFGVMLTNILFYKKIFNEEKEGADFDTFDAPFLDRFKLLCQYIMLFILTCTILSLCIVIGIVLLALIYHFFTKEEWVTPTIVIARSFRTIKKIFLPEPNDAKVAMKCYAWLIFGAILSSFLFFMVYSAHNKEFVTRMQFSEVVTHGDDNEEEQHPVEQPKLFLRHFGVMVLTVFAFGIITLYIQESNRILAAFVILEFIGLLLLMLAIMYCNKVHMKKKEIGLFILLIGIIMLFHRVF